jgi:hypothetical protein
MAPSEMMILELRGMIGEVGRDTYSDEYLSYKLSKHPLVDVNGKEPIVYNNPYANLNGPPTRVPNPYWVPTYDLHAAAASIWEEKAAAVARDYDYSDAGLSASRSQRYDHFMQQARFHRSRRSASTIRLEPFNEASEELRYQREQMGYDIK